MKQIVVPALVLLVSACTGGGSATPALTPSTGSLAGPASGVTMSVTPHLVTAGSNIELRIDEQHRHGPTYGEGTAIERFVGTRWMPIYWVTVDPAERLAVPKPWGRNAEHLPLFSGDLTELIRIPRDAPPGPYAVVKGFRTGKSNGTARAAFTVAGG